MQPVRMKTEVPTDLEGIRRLLLGVAPQMEAKQPGITAQIQYANLSQPVMMMSPTGESITVAFEPNSADPAAASTAIKVEVKPPQKPFGKLRAWFWRWRTRLMVKVALKRAKLSVEKDAAARVPKVNANGAIEPEVMPPER